MLELRQTEVFQRWKARLKDERLRAIIASRLDRPAYGHLGDVAPIGSGVSELRIHYGSGYRVYFMRRQTSIVVLLCGGDKGTQRRDIKAAKRLAAELRDSDA